MQLGTLLQDAGRLDEAAEQHEEAIRLDPMYAQAQANLKPDHANAARSLAYVRAQLGGC